MKGPPKADLIYSDNQIPLLFDYSLRLAPSTYLQGVAVTSQILCISITLNKRKFYNI